MAMSARRLLVAAIGAIVLALILYGGYRGRRLAAGNRSTTTSNSVAPGFERPDVVGGQAVSLNRYRGKVVLLDFWATWCAPCRTEIPHFVEMQQRYGPRRFQVVGVSMDDSDKPVREFYSQFKMNYPVVMGDEKLAESYGGILGLPVSFILDREGRIAAKYVGETDVLQMEAEVRKLLGTEDSRSH